MRRANEPVWTGNMVALAIAAYILCLGGIWGFYGGIALYVKGEHNSTYLGLSYPVATIGYFTPVAGIYMVLLLWRKNRVLAFVVIGMALVSYGLAFIGGGFYLGHLIPLLKDFLLAFFICVGLFLIVLGLATIVAAFLEYEKIDTGVIDFAERDHQGVIHAQPGANNQMNHNHYPTQA